MIVLIIIQTDETQGFENRHASASSSKFPATTGYTQKTVNSSSAGAANTNMDIFSAEILVHGSLHL